METFGAAKGVNNYVSGMRNATCIDAPKAHFKFTEKTSLDIVSRVCYFE